ncbi:hypothetical protein PHISCL_09328 [Aspergillus sclerotialis]|uniref:Aminoglycoside phosphotransferase domain-containing protein n=1 Tax=Aspergillus sclerotialis TaxID=2070753 RepID=A0A3A2Z5J1_9EURO|nr:hypothetical protein PHISCL_09328 [Aspergillus sclerotialis]
MSSTDKQRELEERFGPLLSISEKSLVDLAWNIRRENTNDSFTSAKFISRLNGSYNLVHIVEFDDGVRYVVRVPATGWGERFTKSAKRSLVSQALTMRLVRKKTTIPVPEVYAVDSSSSNLIGAPYIAISYIHGHSVYSKWFDETGPTPMEERRLNILDSLARAMSQLQRLQFTMIGSLESQDGMSENGIKVGPCYRWDEGIFGDDNYGQNLQVNEFEPFESSKYYLRYHIEHYGDPTKHSSLAIGSRALLDMMVSSLPLSTEGASSNRETFVLSLPDFDSQNVMIDEQGNLTGIIDWDHVQTVPRFLGFSSFPGWITRDWDPIIYYYPAIKERENSPEELKRYRQRYNGKMREMLHGKGDSRFVNKSHIFEAISIAAYDNVHRLEIVRKVVARVLRVEDDDALEIIRDMGSGRLTLKETDKLSKGFQALLSVPRH